MKNSLLSLLILLLTLNCFTLKCQTRKEEFAADSVFIYKDFKKFGTTANMRNYHRILDSTHAIKNKMSDGDLAELKVSITGTKSKKLFQQKYGGANCYIIAYSKGRKEKFVFGMGEKYAIFDNLDEMKRWVIKDSINGKKFNDLIRKYWLY